MPFRIDPNKPFDDEIRRAGLELIEEAITSLRDQPSGRHEAVHDARKRFKRLRALYRLIARAAPDFSKEENARFRDIARSLAFAREATALVETVEYLETFAASTTQGKALRSIATVLRKRRDHAIEHEAGLDEAIAAAIAGCEEARKRLKAVSLPDELKDVTRLVKTGWAKQRKRARKALADCHEQADVEHFHELRKAGQAYWMHLGLLRRLWPSAMRAKRADTKRLVDILGHEHDLSVLAAFADREPERFGNGERLALLLDAIIQRQQALRGDGLELANEVFSESARTESRIVGLLWRQAAK
ncbi:CHAD domain-containing protein [Rhizobium rhizogenes]|jgi:CHAD domain-containing protein|uniref:CHAD domain-containing protein n=1 Tax=Rhizobium rhizogenes TaxID=359 RepID=A0AA95AH63_RHIRH|nr:MULTISPECIES: CHAD domain-containing protein [Rhizobium/Agrobacterium group]MDP9562344.1 CHAD domain-containing protein [Rhizobium nepotum]NSY09199.1 CHAD domain-containing protein [Agrobacterium tumefaciens]NSY61399.1 CHAD domain-containing protein [Agrobacterium tumefaciens]NSZ08977.1 CHAD domain-containing protein [Agrobacterium tumefaciens]NTC81138.1 CHAD domain-containing protein [Agrobacterium tumefaciens]